MSLFAAHLVLMYVGFCLMFLSQRVYPLSAVSAKKPELKMIINRYVQILAS